jgi:hypothetical protein
MQEQHPSTPPKKEYSPFCKGYSPGGTNGRDTEGFTPRTISTCNLTGSNHSGLIRRFASRHFKNAECFRILKKPKILVSFAIEKFDCHNRD